jgi:hypothetical protein
LIGFTATRVDTGEPEFVWCDGSPAYGSTFVLDGVAYRRPVPAGFTGKVVTNRGTEIDFSRGPVTMWTEPIQGRGAVAAPQYDEKGYAVFTNNQELREYRARCADSLRPVEWTK